MISFMAMQLNPNQSATDVYCSEKESLVETLSTCKMSALQTNHSHEEFRHPPMCASHAVVLITMLIVGRMRVESQYQVCLVPDRDV